MLTLTAFILTLLFIISSHTYALDSDADGIDNPDDNCRMVPNGPVLGTCTAGELTSNKCTSNEDCGTDGFCSMDQEDSDQDGAGDVCDFCSGNGSYDTDEDGICDGSDNCYSVPNSDQLDSDGDGFGDVCTNNIPMYNRYVSFKGNYEEIGRQVAHAFPDIIIYA